MTFSDLTKVDWTDVGLHVAAAFGAMTALRFLGLDPVPAAVLVTLGGYARELWQAWKLERPLSPLQWSLHKHLEAAVFPATAFLMAVQ